MKRLLLLVSMLTMFCASVATAQNNDMLALVKSKNFRFTASTINSSLVQSDPRFALLMEGKYKLEVDGEWLDCLLPFVGRVYRQGMNDKQIEVFAEKCKYEYNLIKRRKTTEIEVKISAPSRDGSDRFNFTLRIGEKGDATLSVISNNRESVSYTGKVESLKLYR